MITTARPRVFNGRDLHCPHCGYDWHYKGALKQATCPSCSLKVRVAVETKGGGSK